MISVVCPFYNEESIIGASVRLMLSNLGAMAEDWELIVVDDGSRDGSRRAVEEIAAAEPRLRVIGYSFNRGRGYAIRTGAREARGEILVTTEIDSSWGNDIVARLVAEMRRRPEIDIVIASPHLPGGDYRNVPAHRVFFSTFGNWIIRSGLTYDITMNTGMTRCYRREKFLALPLDEDEKEMHLEVIAKAIAFNYRICEIPAVLEWRSDKLAKPNGAARKSSSRIGKLIVTHFLFSILASPSRYIYPISGVIGALSGAFLIWAFVNFAKGEPSIFLLIASLALAIFAFVIFGVGVLAQQGRNLQRDIWRMRAEIRRMGKGDVDT